MGKKWKKVEKYSNNFSEKLDELAKYQNEQLENGVTDIQAFDGNNILTSEDALKVIPYLPKLEMTPDEKALRSLEALGYVGKNLGLGALGSLTGTANSVTQELENNLEIGKEKNKLETIIDPLVSAFSPTLRAVKESAKGIKKAYDIVKDNEKNTLEKVVDLGTSTVSNGIKSAIPNAQLASDQLQLLGNINPQKTDEAINLIKDVDNTISSPYNNFAKYMEEESKKQGNITNLMGNVAGVVGNMAPSIALSAATGNPSIGLAQMGTSVKGQATKEAMEKGKELNKAIEIGDTKAMVEVGTELLTGGIPIFGKGALDDIVVKGIDTKVKNKVMNYLAKQGVGIAGEVLEETVSDVLNTAIDKGTVDSNAKYTLDDWKDTALTTVLSTAVLNALTGSYTPSAFRENARNISESESTTSSSDFQNTQPIAQNNYAELPPNSNFNTTQTYASKQYIDDLTSKINNILPENSQILTEYAELPDRINSKYEDNRITLNESNITTENLGHELTHHLMQQKGYEELSDHILTELDKSGKLDSMKEEIMNTYAPVYNAENRVLSDADIESEIVAKYSEKLFNDEDTINRLTKSNRNLVQKVYDWVVDKINYYKTVKTMNAEQRQEYNTLKKTEKLYRKAMESEKTPQFVNNFQESVNQAVENNFNVVETANTNKNKQDLIDIINSNENLESSIKKSLISGVQQINSLDNNTYNSFLNQINEMDKEYNKLKNESKYSIVGKKGMDNTNSDYLKNKYEQALQMQKIGIENEKIRKATGWFQDKNGDWKFEFSDKDMSLKTNIKLQNDKTYKLGDILQHDTLFIAYPELANYNVKIFSSANVNGSFNKFNKTINISDRLINNSKLIEGTLIHEIQHAIQNIEGFESGKNPQKSKLAYYNSLGEIEATDTKARFLDEKYKNKNLSSIAPESSKTNPQHKGLNKYLENRNIIDKAKDSMYNYFNKKGDYNENFEYIEEKENKDNKKNSKLVSKRTRNNSGSDGTLGNSAVENGRETSEKVQETKTKVYSKDEKAGRTTQQNGEKNNNKIWNNRIDSSIQDNKGRSLSKDQRKHYETIKNSPMVDKFGKNIAENLLEKDRYIPARNKKAIENAEYELSINGLNSSLNKFKNKLNTDKKLTVNDIAMGERLIQEYSKAGDYKTTTELIQDVAMLGTELGQQVQAMSLINKMTPEGQLQLIEKTINRLNSSEKNLKNKVDISDDIRQEILKADNKEKLDEAICKATESIAEQLPVSASDKLRSWRYLCMLGNPTTHIRNISSNIAMKGTMGLKNKIAGAIEDVFNPTERTKTLKYASKEAKAFAEQDSIKMQSRLSDGGHEDIMSKVKFNKRDFDNKALNTISQFNSNMLEKEDWIFLKSAYKNSFANYMTANKLTPEYLSKGTKESNIALEKAREYSINAAQEATFRQFSELASLLNKVENKNSFTKVALGGALPFKKTPINIAKAGVEYSPIGLFKTLTKNTYDLNKGNITVNKYIDNIAKGLTGTAISGLGMVLANAGIIKASGSDDDKEESYSEALGNQSYSVKIGNNTYTLDWLSPTAMPLFVGAELSNAIKSDKGINLNNLTNSTLKTINPLMDMSMMQSLASAITSYNADGTAGKLSDVAVNVAESYAGQFIPTVSGKVAKIIDDTERNTYYSDKKGIERELERFKNKIIAKLPVASMTLQPKTDIWGNEVKRSDNVAVRAFDNLIAPYYKQEIKESKVDNEIQRVYKVTGEGVLPTVPNGQLTLNKNKYTLTPEEYTDYKKTYGKDARKNLDAVIKTKEYKQLSDEEKAKIIKSVYDTSKELSKGEYAEAKSIKYDKSKSEAKIQNLVKSGLSLVNSYIYRGEISKIEGTKKSDGKTIEGSTQGNKAKYIMNMNTDATQKNKLLSLLNDSEKAKDVTVADLSKVKKDSYNTFFSLGTTEDSKGFSQRDKYLMMRDLDIDSTELDKYFKEVGKIKGEKDDEGKTISNTKKLKVLNYIGNLDLDPVKKIILFAKAGYEDGTEGLLTEYLSQTNLTTKRKLEIMSMLYD